jgi:hypothetical protein
MMACHGSDSSGRPLTEAWPLGRLIAALSQACCRHAYLRKAGQARLWLECADCGHRTPGMHVATGSRERGRGGHVLTVCQDH